jgi:hypothetical protein
MEISIGPLDKQVARAVISRPGFKNRHFQQAALYMLEPVEVASRGMLSSGRAVVVRLIGVAGQ